MSDVGQRERPVQDRVVLLFADRLGCRYLGNRQYRPGNANIEQEDLRTWLRKQDTSETLITRALHRLTQAAAVGEGKTLYEANREVYGLLRYGVKAAQERVRRREGGIIWHTQGSGKSLTMVWLAKWIRENVQDGRVLIITDRTELDQQIEKVFKGVDENIYRTDSGADLISTLGNTNPWLICSLVHKFGRTGTTTEKDFARELQENLPGDFHARGDIFVFVDECHRTQSGELHDAMKTILPNAMFIGFTGTPLLKADKQKSIEVFGPYIHTYKYDEAVRDGAVLDLRYEARDIDQEITSRDRNATPAQHRPGKTPATLERLVPPPHERDAA